MNITETSKSAGQKASSTALGLAGPQAVLWATEIGQPQNLQDEYLFALASSLSK